MSWHSSAALADLVVAAHDEARAATDPALIRGWRSIGDRLAEIEHDVLVLRQDASLVLSRFGSGAQARKPLGDHVPTTQIPPTVSSSTLAPPGGTGSPLAG